MQRTDSPERRLADAGLWLLVALCVLLYFLYASSYFDHNDLMFGAAPVIWSGERKLYIDLPFVQAPLSILVPALLHEVFGTGHLYLSARLLSQILVLASVLLLAQPLWRAENRLPALVFICLATTNGLVLSAAKEVGSYALPMFFLSLAFHVSTRPMNLRNKVFWISLSVGLATSAKINHIVMLPALLFWAWPRPELNRGALFMAVPGLLLGLLPTWFFLLRDPQSFYVNNFEFHMLMNMVRGLDLMSSVKSVVLGMLLFAGYNLIPLLVVLPFLYLRKGPWQERAKIVFLLFSCFILAIAPMVLFAQYLCVLSLFLLYFSVRETELAARGMRKLAYPVLLLQLLPQAANIFPQDQILSNEPFAVSSVAAIQKRARESTAGWRGCERKVFTTHPLFYLDRKAIYPAEAAAGPYWYMVRSGLPEGHPARQHIAGKLADFAPNIVVYGRYSDGSYRPNEDVIEEYARQHGFRIIEIGEINDRPIMMGLRKACF